MSWRPVVSPPAKRTEPENKQKRFLKRSAGREIHTKGWLWRRVLTFNSCTKCVGSPDRMHNRTPDFHPVFRVQGCMDTLITERSIDLQATWAIAWLIFLHVIYGCLYNQALADVRSTRARIKCLHCSQSQSCFFKTKRYPSHIHVCSAAMLHLFNPLRTFPVIVMMDTPLGARCSKRGHAH